MVPISRLRGALETRVLQSNISSPMPINAEIMTNRLICSNGILKLIATISKNEVITKLGPISPSNHDQCIPRANFVQQVSTAFSHGMIDDTQPPIQRDW